MLITAVNEQCSSVLRTLIGGGPLMGPYNHKFIIEEVAGADDSISNLRC